MQIMEMQNICRLNEWMLDQPLAPSELIKKQTFAITLRLELRIRVSRKGKRKLRQTQFVSNQHPGFGAIASLSYGQAPGHFGCPTGNVVSVDV